MERHGRGSCELPRRGKEGDGTLVWGGEPDHVTPEVCGNTISFPDDTQTFAVNKTLFP